MRHLILQLVNSSLTAVEAKRNVAIFLGNRNVPFQMTAPLPHKEAVRQEGRSYFHPLYNVISVFSIAGSQKALLRISCRFQRLTLDLDYCRSLLPLVRSYTRRCLATPTVGDEGYIQFGNICVPLIFSLPDAVAIPADNSGTNLFPKIDYRTENLFECSG